MFYLSKHLHQKIRQHAIVMAVTILHLLFLVCKVILYYCCCAAKTAIKQGYIHASYQAPEMAFFEYSFFLQIFQVFKWFEFSSCLKS